MSRIRGTANVLCDRFDRIREVAGRESLAQAVLAGARVVVQEAKRIVPVRTGNLQRSLHVGGYGSDGGLEGETTGTDIGGKTTSDTSASLLVGTNVHYAGFVEFGTSRMAARPYLRPALDEHADDVAHVIGQELRKTLEAESCR